MSAEESIVTEWAPPPLDECDEERMPVALDEKHLLSVRRVLWRKQLVAFAIVLSRKVGHRNVELVCIDTMNHGCVHRHDGDHNSPYKTIREICSQQDVQDSYNDAYDEVYNHYLKLSGLDPLR